MPWIKHERSTRIQYQYDMKTAGILFRDIERGNLKPDRRSYDLMLRGTCALTLC